ncbi:HEAT repeat domain-containing protein, partial [Limnospira fusiformis KN01]|uniref:HEAT repeat domain-containing protein n=1 Tax=Limnospira fusiformis TaxID=54297 RepID=UPI001658B107
CGEWNFEKVDREFYEYQAYFLAAAGINEFKACSLAAGIVRQVVKWGFGYFNIERQKWRTFIDPIEEGARKAIPETIRRLAVPELSVIIENCPGEDTRRQAAESLGAIDPGNADAIAGLVEIIRNTEDEYTRLLAAWSLEEIDPGNPDAIAGLVEVIRNTEDEDTRREAAQSLGEIDPGNPDAIAVLVEVIRNTEDEHTRRWAVESLDKIGQGNPEAISEAISVLVNLIATTKSKWIRGGLAASLGKIGQGNPEAISVLVNLIATTRDDWDRRLATASLGKILTTRQNYTEVVAALKDNLSDKVYQNNFHRFHECYKLIWNCAENLPYPDFYQAWHNPPTTSDPEVTEQTPHSGEPSFASPLTWESLQHLPLYCLNADLLADETRESEIALKLCELIWKQLKLKEIYPEVSTPGQLCRYLNQLQLNEQFSHRAILFAKHRRSGDQIFLEPTQPTPEAIAFCQKLTGVIAIAFLTEEPLEAPLKGFPPNQRNLISAIETWLGEI